jgi:hydrophobic/amphiphilic exporter-1 (mainly G- bacteria), HAE1 family
VNLTAASIRRPIATTLAMLAILLFGFMGYRLLPVSDLPNVDFPTILVSANLPGASPETMASSVATPLERQFSTIAGVDAMTSTSTLGSTQVTLQFSLERNIDAAAQDVQSAITQAGPQLPPNLPSPPSIRKVNPADQPVLYLTLSSKSLRLSDVDEYAETFVAQRISTTKGVAQVQVFGSQKYAVRVQVDPQALASRQIGIDEVRSAIAAGNVNLPTGVLWGPNRAVTVRASGQLADAAAYRPLVVAYRNGAPVRVEDVGTAVDGVENDKIASWVNGDRGIGLAVQRQPGTNTVEVVDAIKQLLPVFRAQMPPAVDLNVLYDRSTTIRDSVDDVRLTLFLAVLLVVLVIFLFLRRLSATVIPALALPMSIVGTFAVMYLLGYSLDNLSMMALTLSVGFVVDDAIVVLENIVRHVEMGKSIREAALEGSKEIGFTIVSMTLSLAAVFVPVLFMGGILGRLLHEFSVTIMAAILVSGVVSLTLTPMMCSRFLRPHRAERRGRLYEASERVFESMVRGYDRSLRFVTRHGAATLLVSLVLLVATVWLFVAIPKGFLPSEDTGSIFVFSEAAEGISYDDMAAHQRKLAGAIADNPYIENFISSIGGGSPGVIGNTNTGRIFMKLKPRSGRPHVDQIIEQLRPKLASVPGIRAYPQNPPPIRIGGQLSRSLYQVTLQSPDTSVLYPAATAMLAKMRELPGLQDVATDLQITSPQLDVHIDRDKASTLGITAEQVEDALFSAYGSRQVSTIYAPNNDYRVILELEPRFQRDPSALSLLYLRAATGKLVPLSTVATLAPGRGPLAVSHLGQLPAVTLSFNLRPGVSLGDAIVAVNAVAAEALPAGVTTNYQGAAQAFESSLTGLGVLLVATIVVIYLILGILYESFVHPLTILSGLPSAGFGALLTLMAFHQAAANGWISPQADMTLDLYGFVGVILLIGIVKKNAIMMIDFALEAQRRDGVEPAEAIRTGALVRFRPIMMTTMAALMSTLPIALGFGAGAEARRSLGVAVVGGLVFSQVVTLYLTPVLYVTMERARRFVLGRFRSRTSAVESLAPPIAPRA